IVSRQFQEVPIETLIVIPFVPLAKFATHEEQLFPWLPVHPRKKHPQIGKFLPFVARHFTNERTFPVNNFIMTQDKDEMFLESVEQRKRNVAVMESAKDRIKAHVLQEVVHPTHVPFESESETAEISRSRNARPGS